MPVDTTTRSVRSSAVSARARWMWIPALVALCLLVFALFAPFGLRRIPWQDTWFYDATVQQGELLAPLLSSRPISHLVWQTIYQLVPQSFLLMSGTMAVAILLKGALVYGIVRLLLPRQPPIAFLAMLLAMIYPAEVGFFQDIYLSVHTGFTAYLFAVYLMLRYQRQRQRRLLVGALLALGFSIATYETVQALVWFTPVLFVWREGRLNRSVARLTLLWLLPELVYLIYVGLLAVGGLLVTREVGLVTQALGGENPILEVVRANLWNLERQFVVAWQNTLEFFPGWRSPLTLIAVAAGAPILALFALYCWLGTAITRPMTWRRGLLALGMGVLLVVAGYAVLSLSSVRYDGYRTAFYTTLGAGLALAVVLYGVAECFRAYPGVRNGLLLAGTALVLGLATTRMLDLHRWQAEVSGWEQRVLQTIMRTAPRPDPDAVIVYRMPADRTYAIENFVNSLWFDSALEVVYGDPGIEGVICRIGAGTWGYQSEDCSLDETGLHYHDAYGDRTYPYEQLIIFDYNADDTTSLAETVYGGDGQQIVRYDPLPIAGVSSPLPAYYDTIFNPRPLIRR